MQEHTPDKQPVIFVHGIGGTPRDFAAIVSNLDTNKIEPWFFYYPSGDDLDKMARLFYEIFLSGNLVKPERCHPIICAHSMGGIVVRKALSIYRQERRGSAIPAYVSLCTPYGGNEAAAAGVRSAPLVLPAWRNVAVGSRFIKTLFSTPLPDSLQFHLLFGFRNTGSIKTGENSDGTIALESQLRPEAQSDAVEIHGYNETHTGILESSAVISHLKEIFNGVIIKNNAKAGLGN